MVGRMGGWSVSGKIDLRAALCAAANGQRAGARLPMSSARDQRPELARRARRDRLTSCRSAIDNARVDGPACKGRGSHVLPLASLNSHTTSRSAVRARCNRCRCAAVIAHFPHGLRPRQTAPAFALPFARLAAAPMAALIAAESRMPDRCVGTAAACSSRCNAGNRMFALSKSWQPRKMTCASRCEFTRNAAAPQRRCNQRHALRSLLRLASREPAPPAL